MNEAQKQAINNQFEVIKKIVEDVNSFVESSNRVLEILEMELTRLKELKVNESYEEGFLKYLELKRSIKGKVSILKASIKNLEKTIKKTPLPQIKERMLLDLNIAKNKLKTLNL
ncbi:hypothetical protein [Ureibacillus endophyticus]|uniref:Uncharacterized protein n=1 Tax=Ureibacillus endophyticus TaxID=1978490 RepID=A0A494YRR8_9BACL|nr:hypothetical protein [Lysinibacillus endophyticus]RKQ12278.1 hypothetical protein D8M03_17160 [Lysinibacillus endophyticus]